MTAKRMRGETEFILMHMEWSPYYEVTLGINARSNYCGVRKVI